MKNTFLLVMLLQTMSVCHGQNTEISVLANSGFSYFGGKSATSTPAVFISDVGPPFWYVTPFSKKSNFPYGLAVQIQHISAKNLCLGVKTGYDRFSSQSYFTKYTSMGGHVPVKNGRITLRNHLVQVNPYVGYRWLFKKIRLDAQAGITASFTVKRTNDVSFDDKPVFFDGELDNFASSNTRLDVGPTIGLAIGYKRTGVQASYCHGLVNYMNNAYFSNARAYSRYVRLGLFYRLL